MRVSGTPLKSTLGPTPLGEQTSRRKIRYLAQSVVLEETGNPFLAKLVIGTVALIVLAFMLWAVVTRVDEVAMATGKVVPTGQVQVVQHLDGGVVSAILVREGDMVVEGQPLVLLDATSLKTELREMRLREASLRLHAQRLEAFVNKKSLDFSNIESGYGELVLDQKKVYDAQVRARDESVQVLRSRVMQKQNEIDLLINQNKTFASKLVLLQEEFELKKRLSERGLISKMSFLEMQRELNQLQGDMEQTVAKQKMARNALEESQNNLKEVDAQLTNQATTEMGTVRAELAQVQETLKRLVSRVEGTRITAKVAGTVQSLGVNSPGGVVAPRAVVLEIVPLGRELVVEARISSRDIGHVKVNQPVSVKFTAYDFARYGGVSGQLQQISPTTFLDEHGEPYYKAVMSLDATFVGAATDSRPILPGMTVQVNVMTGNKTVMEYLLKPIYASVHRALQER